MGTVSNPQVIVAGHICLDIIPTLGQRGRGADAFLSPGKLVKVGPAVLATGGAVSNTGLALHRLGVATRLMGKVGDDVLGRAILDVLRQHDGALADGMVVARGEPSSYTVVISPPGIDRMFLHCPGVNDTFCAADVRDETLAGARLFHFGYPPIMRRMFADGGRELASLFRRVKARGLATSLDMTMVDPDSEAGRVDWRALLARVLPHVDVFLPSLEEILFMLDRARFEQLARKGGPAAIVAQADVALLRRLSGELLAMGATMVVLKLGDQGLYVRTTGNEQRLAAIGLTVGSDRRARRTDGPAVRPYFSKEWLDREAHAPCFKVNVVGTTGSGDCTIAGFLAGLLRGLPLEDVMTAAVAVGACCCEKTDATSGVPSWSALQKRIRAGWGRRAANPKIRIRNPKEI